MLADDADAVRRLRERATRAVTAPVKVLRPETPQELRERLRDLLAGGDAELVWLEAVAGGAGWTEAWDDLLLRLNERRERLRKGLCGGLILVAPTALKARIREAAPDLWSIRALVLELSGRGAPAASDDRAARSNAYRIAEAVLRTHFHLRMHRDPWFALVIGDDPAPRRRLLDELAASGLEVRVHSTFGEAFRAPDDDVALHWLEVRDDPPLGLLEAIEGRAPPAAPLFVEGSRALEAALTRAVPELYARCALVVHLYVERALHPGPLPQLAGAEQTMNDAWVAVAEARSLERVLDTTPDGEDLRRQRVASLGRAIEALLTQGWGSEAAPLADEMREAAAALGSDPRSRALAADAEELAGAVARHLGDVSEALARHLAALPIRRDLARRRGPDRRKRRSELARCLSRLGEMELAAGHLDEAEAALREALELRRRLARGSDDRETLSELALSWSLVGDLEVARHDVGNARLDAARGAYVEALRLREKVASAEATPRFRRMLSMALGRLGRLHARASAWADARDAWSRARDLARRVSSEDPGNVAWAMEASVAASLLGDAARALGDLAQAEAAYREAVEQREKMVAEDPENARWQELLAVALGRLADAALARGDLEAAARASERATGLSEQLAWMDPANLTWRHGLARSWLRRGDVDRARGDERAATTAWRRASAVADRIEELGTEEAERRARQIRAALRTRTA